MVQLESARDQTLRSVLELLTWMQPRRCRFSLPTTMRSMVGRQADRSVWSVKAVQRISTACCMNTCATPRSMLTVGPAKPIRLEDRAINSPQINNADLVHFVTTNTAIIQAARFYCP